MNAAFSRFLTKLVYVWLGVSAAGLLLIARGLVLGWVLAAAGILGAAASFARCVLRWRRSAAELRRSFPVIDPEAGAFEEAGRQFKQTKAEAAALKEQLEQSERSRRHSDERLQLAARATKDTIWDWDLRTQARWWNDGCQLIFGYRPAELPDAEAWSERVHPHDRAGMLARLRAAIDCGDEGWSDEYRFRRADGSYAQILDCGYVLRDRGGQPLRMVGAMADITERRKAEEEVRRLSGRILEAQEVERSRVARELHDGVNQIISAAKLWVQLIRERLPPEHETLVQHASRTNELLERALHEVRHISRNLRPSELDDLGLMAALRSTCQEFRERTGIRLELEAGRFPEILPPEVELALYRIIQEALFNIERHAHAHHVSLRLSREQMTLCVVIRDDGGGFGPKQQTPSGSGLGLLNMKERAAFIGGTVKIHSAVGAGTEVHVTVPALPNSAGSLSEEV